MASALMGETTVSMLRFSPAVIAIFVDKDVSTVKRWFLKVPGVRKFPRGLGAQNPSLEIPEAVMRDKLREIGYSDAEIDTGLVIPHRQRLDRQLEVERARATLLESPQPKRKRGRPPKAAKPPEPVAKKTPPKRYR